MPESQKNSRKTRDILIPPSEVTLPLVDEIMSRAEYEKLSTSSYRIYAEAQRIMYNSTRSTEDALKDILPFC